ncbi:anti-sigma factor antagonist [Pseudonocardia endophytica]|uniref:Anti-sigma factor antagonist n=1 Tax=Pseudonocardia endophytica TaxID=401976 RepID=A0A4R1I0V5_PSEEN|nr:anti-sigma factor antagonist [Pseudonocardia endophytica]TCK26850.1 anti-anti-sigma factor [Pseudonocardia endophytica]
MAAESAAHLDVGVDVRLGAVVVTVAGEVDPTTVDRLEAAIAAVLGRDDGRPLVVDLVAVEFLGSVGVATLLDAVGRFARAEVGLCFVVGTNRAVVRPLRISGIVTRVDTCTSVSEALDALDDPD